jgi:hypothetical protein
MWKMSAFFGVSHHQISNSKEKLPDFYMRFQQVANSMEGCLNSFTFYEFYSQIWLTL